MMSIQMYRHGSRSVKIEIIFIIKEMLCYYFIEHIQF